MRKIRNSRSIFLVAFLMLTSCSAPIENSPNRYTNQSKKEIKHLNGLTIKTTPTLSVSEDANGFLILPKETFNARYSISLRVSLNLNQTPPASDAQTKHRQLTARKISYQLSKAQAGGASGDEIIYNLQAWEIIPNGFILYEQETPESHFGEHRFDALWSVLENTNFQIRK